jgi:hypothetical protein
MNTTNKETDGRLRVLINASTYSSENLRFREIVAGVTWPEISTWQEMETATRLCEPIYRPGIQMLDTVLGKECCPCLPGGQLIHRMFGKYTGDIEPSISVEFATSPSNLPRVKKQIIQFGEAFHQKTVHIGYSLGPNFPSFDSPNLPEAETLEIAWLVSLKRLHSVGDIFNLTAEAGVQDLSFKQEGFQLLVYSLGNTTRSKIPTLTPETKRLRELLRQRDLILKEKSWYMALSNFGSGYCATHDYSQARRLLEVADRYQ